MLKCDEEEFVHNQDLIINMAMNEDDSITPQDIRKIIECRITQLTYKWCFSIRKDERGILLKDNPKEEDDEDRGKPGEEILPASDDEICLKQLHRFFQTAEQVKSQRLEIWRHCYQ